MRPIIRVIFRWLISFGILGLLLVWIEPGRVLAELDNVQPGWLALALAVSVVQVGLSAWRWQFTAQRLDLDLGWRQAFFNYYLASLINQVLPGGMAGDAWRAHHHGRHSGQRGPAWRAVIIERASGQLIVAVLTVAAVVMVPDWRTAMASPAAGLTVLVLLLAIISVLGLFVYLSRRWQEVFLTLRKDTHHALLARSAWPAQLGSSLLIVFSYTLVFALSARGIGISLDFLLLLALAMPVLLAMLIPVTVAGWGFREAAAAGIWISLGMNPEQGIAAALAYGLVVLVAALPGIIGLAPVNAGRSGSRQRPPPLRRLKNCSWTIAGPQQADRSAAVQYRCVPIQSAAERSSSAGSQAHPHQQTAKPWCRHLR